MSQIEFGVHFCTQKVIYWSETRFFRLFDFKMVSLCPCSRAVRGQVWVKTDPKCDEKSGEKNKYDIEMSQIESGVHFCTQKVIYSSENDFPDFLRLGWRYQHDLVLAILNNFTKNVREITGNDYIFFRTVFTKVLVNELAKSLEKQFFTDFISCCVVVFSATLSHSFVTTLYNSKNGGLPIAVFI